MEHNFGFVNAGDRLPKDAVHIPVVQVYTLDELFPGDQVYFNSHECVSKYKPGFTSDYFKPVGIVDPFLPKDKPVPHAKWFWVLMNPGLVTKLKHDWEHDDVPDGPFRTDLPEPDEDGSYYDECRECY